MSAAGNVPNTPSTGFPPAKIAEDRKPSETSSLASVLSRSSLISRPPLFETLPPT